LFLHCVWFGFFCFSCFLLLKELFATGLLFCWLLVVFILEYCTCLSF
jgi:hypothetical protein